MKQSRKSAALLGTAAALALDIAFALRAVRGLWMQPLFSAAALALAVLVGAALVLLAQMFALPKGAVLGRALERFYNRRVKEDLARIGRGEAADNTDVAEAFQEYTQRVRELTSMRQVAENNALQSQITPHFLYNTLDTIRGQALEEEAPATADMLESLSRIFRYSIDQKKGILTLEDELLNVRDYLKIQQCRYRGRFTVEYDVDEEDTALMYAAVPKLTLQPLVENAIKHGLEGYVSGGRIRIRAYLTKRFLYLQVEDNGVGIDAEKLKAMNRALAAGEDAQPASGKTAHGIAVKNVNLRIKMHFGSEYGLTLYSSDHGGTVSEVCLPNRSV